MKKLTVKEMVETFDEANEVSDRKELWNMYYNLVCFGFISTNKWISVVNKIGKNFLTAEQEIEIIFAS